MNRAEVKREVVNIINHMTPNELADIKAEAVMQVFDKYAPRFNIDFFEFGFLVEASIPPRPIARTAFWHDCINKYFHILTESERCNLHRWINLNSFYEKNLEKKCKDTVCFENRYNPDNQYEVTSVRDGKKEVFRAFKQLDRNGDEYFATGTNAFLVADYIVDVKKLDLSEFSR